MASKLNPRTEHYEFMGPPGALFVTVSAPLMTYALFVLCSDSSGGHPPSLPQRFVAVLSDPNWWKEVFEFRPLFVYLAWYAYCVLAWYLLPGTWIEGAQMRNGRKKIYKMNGEVALL
jgi:hypothetical protein